MRKRRITHIGGVGYLRKPHGGQSIASGVLGASSIGERKSECKPAKSYWKPIPEGEHHNGAKHSSGPGLVARGLFLLAADMLMGCRGPWMCCLRTQRIVAGNLGNVIWVLIVATASVVGAELLVPSQYPTIQAAINAARNGDEVIAFPGVYFENINFLGKAIIVRSVNPDDTNIVASTVINGSRALSSADEGSVVTFNHFETSRAALSGFSLVGGIGFLLWPRYGVRVGGGIYCSNSSPTITSCLIISNTAGTGGGVYCGFGSPKFMGCNLSYNTAVVGGGAYLCYAGCPRVSRCVISKNKATQDGGGIYCVTYGGMILDNSLICGNSAQRGGGILVQRCTAYIKSTDILGNTGAGIFAYDDGHPDVLNSILWLNRGGQIWLGPYDPTIKIRYSGVQGGYVGEGNLNIDPRFVQAGFWDEYGNWVDGDYHLLEDSPCIDRGIANYVPGPCETDLDGLPRVIGGRIDMGAYEFDHAPVANAGPDQVAYAWIDGLADVTLDGSGSYDEDNDILSYLWRWTIEGKNYETNGVRPTIRLPVGTHQIELVVNDGWKDSQPDYVVVTVFAPVEGQLRVLPEVINGHGAQPHILAILRLPAGVTGGQIDLGYKLKLYPGGIEAQTQHVFEYRHRGLEQVVIAAFFDRSALLGAVSGNGPVRLDAVGRLVAGQYFCGQDTVRIINLRARPRSQLWPAASRAGDFGVTTDPFED